MINKEKNVGIKQYYTPNLRIIIYCDGCVVASGIGVDWPEGWNE